MMINLGKLKDRYAVTDKVIARRFEHRYLGVIDLANISEIMAEKLVATGHLKRIVRKKKPVKKLIE